MIDILDIIVKVSNLEEDKVKTKFGVSKGNVTKVLKTLLLEQLLEEDNSNSSTDKKQYKSNKNRKIDQSKANGSNSTDKA